MFVGPNTIAIKLGSTLQGSAEGQPCIAALLIILLCATAFIVMARR